MSLKVLLSNIAYLKKNKYNFKSNKTCSFGQNDEICSICHETLETNLSTTSCNHTFHKNCLCNWLNNKNTCPMCRTTFTPEEIQNICGDLLPQKSERQKQFERMWFKRIK